MTIIDCPVCAHAAAHAWWPTAAYADHRGTSTHPPPPNGACNAVHTPAERNQPMWTYRASCQRVIDADTLVLNIDLGFFATISITARLAGIDAPEMDTDAGHIAKRFVEDWIHADPGEWPLTVTTRKIGPRDKYGRWVALIQRSGESTQTSLNQQLIDLGHATVWPPPKPAAPQPARRPTATEHGRLPGGGTTWPAPGG